MKLIDLVKHHCIICKKSDKKLKFVPKYGIYGWYDEGLFSNGDYYHEDCLKEVVCNYEKYGNNLVDTAISISYRIKSYEKFQQHEEESRKRRANTYCKYWHEKKE
jgi:hypothetical protein